MAITKIVLTGGPCGGKSSALTKIGEVFSNRGYRVLFISESATELITGGISPLTCASNENFQIHIMEHQLNKEKLYMSVAEQMSYEDILIICDRGTLDNKVYMNQREFFNVLTANNTSEEDLLNNYDAVFHLETAAKGALEAYTLSNNAARRETPEEAVKLDDALIEAWKDHPHLFVIDNSTDFRNKIKRLIQEIATFIGDTELGGFNKRYLVKTPDLDWIREQNNYQKMEISTTFLHSTSPNEEKCLRKLYLNDQIFYILRTSILDGDKISSTREVFLDKNNYVSLLSEADSAKKKIYEAYYSFILNRMYIGINTFSFWTDEAIVLIEAIEKNMSLELPTEFTLVKEITDDDDYSNAQLVSSHAI